MVKGTEERNEERNEERSADRVTDKTKRAWMKERMYTSPGHKD